MWQEIDPSIAELLNQQQAAKNSSDYGAGLLNQLIGRKDRVTGEIFRAGEEIYVCFRCELGYHQDSWDFLEQQCEQCGAIAPKIQKILLPIPDPSPVLAKDHPQGALRNSSAQDSQEAGTDPSRELDPESIAAIEPSSEQPPEPSPALSPQKTPPSSPEIDNP
ncbi:MAG: hypothetical protein HC796_07945 [Synechococcaceae cyanobacterium RL_1_2]|nr:hypothetical protein [Synechococcaceae cyanobacterium RL_1_2]